MITRLLADTHVLVLINDQRLAQRLVKVFGSMGASCYAATNQNEALGVYWKLFRAGIRPRVVVSSWWLVDPRSKEFEFLKMLDRDEIDATAVNLFKNILDLDPSATLMTYTQDPYSAEVISAKHGLKVEVFNRTEHDVVAFASRVAMHASVNKQRQRESIELEVRNDERMKSSANWDAGQIRTFG
jgi:hypothetical protein